MTYGEKMRKEGWKNVYDELPEEAGEYLVEDHAGHRFKTKFYIYELCGEDHRAWESGRRGYDICWWKKGEKEMNEIVTYQSYTEYKAELDAELQKSTEGFVKIGYLLKLARDTDILRESGYATVNDFARAEYNIDKTLVSRFININDRFSENGNSPQLKEQYRGFGYAKLAIMLQLPDAVNEELSPGFSKAEIQEVKEEYVEEQKISDLEVALEEIPKGQQGNDSNLAKAIRQIGHDNTELYQEIYMVMDLEEEIPKGLQEAFAPSGEGIYSVRIPGTGKVFLHIKDIGSPITVTNLRTNEKETFSWEDIINAVASIVISEDTLTKSWETVYGEVFPKQEEPKKEPEKAPEPKSVSTTQKKPKEPKKKSKVTKVEKREEKPKDTPSEKISPKIIDITNVKDGNELKDRPEGQQDEDPYYKEVYEESLDIILGEIERAKVRVKADELELAKTSLTRAMKELENLIKIKKDHEEVQENG